jgi:hypothetical protein
VSDAAGMRASDAEREQAADALREHYAAGRLTAEEFGERLDAVYTASTVRELEHLRHDLPDLPPSPAARSAELQRRQAELRGQLLQRAGGSFTPFVICTVIWAASGASGSFWPAWVLIIPIVFLGRNIWRLYGPAPELDRVQRELEHRSRHRRQRRPHELP